MGRIVPGLRGFSNEVGRGKSYFLGVLASLGHTHALDSKSIDLGRLRVHPVRSDPCRCIVSV